MYDRLTPAVKSSYFQCLVEAMYLPDNLFFSTDMSAVPYNVLICLETCNTLKVLDLVK